MKLVIRSDGGPSIGFGHLVRTGAIAETFLTEGHSVVYCSENTKAVEAVCPEDVTVFSLKGKDDSPSNWIEKTGPDLVLTDTYEASTQYQREISDKVYHAVIVDDSHQPVCANVVINGNIYGPDLQYDWVGAEPTWCLGTEYLPIRGEIRQRRMNVEPIRNLPKEALITMGGSDISNTTPSVIRAFGKTGLNVTVIVGPGFTNKESIESAVAIAGASFETLVAPTDLPEIMASADLAVSAAGSTIYELLALGTPAIAIPQADNQEPIAATLDERGIVEHLPARAINKLHDRIVALISDQDRRRRYVDRGMDLVDCRGTDRIYSKLKRNCP